MVRSIVVRALPVALLISSTMAFAAPHKKPHAVTKPSPKVQPTEKLNGTGGISPGPINGPPELLFTFDDGPAIGNTPKVLDLLDQYHIKAVFFVNGWHFQGNKPRDEEE